MNLDSTLFDIGTVSYLLLTSSTCLEINDDCQKGYSKMITANDDYYRAVRFVLLHFFQG